MNVICDAGCHLSLLNSGDASTGKHHHDVHIAETKDAPDGRAARIAGRTWETRELELNAYSDLIHQVRWEASHFIPTSIVARFFSLCRKYFRNWAVQDMARSLNARVSPWNNSRTDRESLSETIRTVSAIENLHSACEIRSVQTNSQTHIRFFT